jgi:hypothetical protein
LPHDRADAASDRQIAFSVIDDMPVLLWPEVFTTQE